MKIPSKYDELEYNMWTCIFHDASPLNGETHFSLMKNYIFVKIGVATYFFFLFFLNGKSSKNKNLKMILDFWKSYLRKTEVWVQRSGYLSGKYLQRSNTPLGLKMSLLAELREI